MLSAINRAAAGRAILVWIVASILAVAACADEPNGYRSASRLKVLLLSAGGERAGHATAPVLRRILAESGRFDVRICESPAGLTGRMLADFDVVVDDYAGPPLGSETEATIAGFVEAGKGLVVTHGALASASGLRPPGDESAAIGLKARTAIPGAWPVVAAGVSETPVGFFQVKIGESEHALVRGLSGGFRTADAILPGLMITPLAVVLATARVDVDGGAAKEEPVLVASSYGKGRVLVFALGHDPSAMHEKELIAAFARGTEWAATGTVTLPASLNPFARNAGAVKALMITGGHDHEVAFYSLFDGHKDLDWMPVMTSAEGFKNDLRRRFDVVIMYDFSRDLDDQGKKNLREFVESGGGVVVLHHALLNYQSWPWWSEEVVGGRYRLSREGASGSSSVKNDQQIYVTPKSDHPITAELGPFHITDEAYKNLWMSPKIRPLLTTDNPTSDTILAWLGPTERFQVVAIQLGHGHSAFDHPAYRALVHRAVLWAARKLK
jgi:type 1 glutamine amidotransferase